LLSTEARGILIRLKLNARRLPDVIRPGRQAPTAVAVLLAALALPGAALAQTRTLAEIAAFQGPDRMARLVEGAKREGSLTLYISKVAEDTNPLIDDFRKKHGVDVQVWRGANEAVVQRAIVESRAGRCPADDISSGWSAVEALHREKLLQPVQSPTTADLMPQALQPHGEYVGIDLNMIIAAYNTSLVKPNEVPKSLEDLKAPRWKGRLAIEADDVDWFAAVVNRIGEPGLGLFREIARTNGFALRKGHTLLANLVAAGEVPLALTVYRYKPEQLKAAGAPIEPLYLPPVAAFLSSVAVTRCAPHPNAAVLFHEFMLHDGQEIYARRNLMPTNLKVRPLPTGVALTLMDPVDMLDHREKWTELWDKTIVHPQ
jgi:iron(III) transport system substrate-binding protein